MNAYFLLFRDGDTQIALVTFKEAQALDTALLLSVRGFFPPVYRFLLICLASLFSRFMLLHASLRVLDAQYFLY